MTDLLTIGLVVLIQMFFIVLALISKYGVLLVGAAMLGVYNLARLFNDHTLTWSGNANAINGPVTLGQPDLNVAVAGLAIMVIMPLFLLIVMRNK